jgi:type I restriction enzyme S subunit
MSKPAKTIIEPGAPPISTNWPVEKLGDLIRFQGGGTPDRKTLSFWDGSIRWASVKDLDSKDLNTTEESISESGLRSSAATIVEPGNVILASRVGLGKVCMNHISVAINQDLKAAIPITDTIDRRYLLHYLCSKSLFLQKIGVGATVKGVRIEDLQALEMPVPPLEEQRRIAGILDKSDTLLETRRQSITKLASFLKSTFFSLFGDPSCNSMGWNCCSMADLFDTNRPGTKCGPFGSALKRNEYTDHGIPVWGIDNVNFNRFVEPGSLFISESKYRELEAYRVMSGDILITRAGTVGRMCVARPTTAIPSIIGTNLIRLSLNSDVILPEYLCSLLSYAPGVGGSLRASSDDSAYSFMNTGTIKSLLIPVPPLVLQEKYLQIFRLVRTAEEDYQRSLTSLQALCASLQQQAFRSSRTRDAKQGTNV